MNNELDRLLEIMLSFEKRIESLENKEKELRQRTRDTISFVKDISEQLLRIVNELS